jgi:hypothetical protein
MLRSLGDIIRCWWSLQKSSTVSSTINQVHVDMLIPWTMHAWGLYPKPLQCCQQAKLQRVRVTCVCVVWDESRIRGGYVSDGHGGLISCSATRILGTWSIQDTLCWQPSSLCAPIGHVSLVCPHIIVPQSRCDKRQALMNRICRRWARRYAWTLDSNLSVAASSGSYYLVSCDFVKACIWQVTQGLFEPDWTS